MYVEDGESPPRLHICMDEIHEQRALARARTSYDIQVTPPRVLADTNEPCVVSKTNATKGDDISGFPYFEGSGRFQLGKLGHFHLLCLDGQGGRME